MPASAARALAFVDEHGTTAASLDWTAADLATGGLELGLGAADTVQTNNSLERMLTHQLAAMHRSILKMRGPGTTIKAPSICLNRPPNLIPTTFRYKQSVWSRDGVMRVIATHAIWLLCKAGEPARAGRALLGADPPPELPGASRPLGGGHDLSPHTAAIAIIRSARSRICRGARPELLVLQQAL